ncbi:MAG: hypothetical protein MUP76_05965, partial [Acidimicrobiia bacterium]|nr:hypothetical protein [Acidimicrobiia bacterium]
RQGGQKRVQGHEGATDSGMAAGFPQGDVVLAVTPKRFLVFKFAQVSGKPKELLAEYPLEQVTAGPSRVGDRSDQRPGRPVGVDVDTGGGADVEPVAARPADTAGSTAATSSGRSRFRCRL